MPVKEHIHRYIRAVGRKTKSNSDSAMINYYRCTDPDCTHYLPVSLVLGKRSICNRCGAEFILPSAVRNLTNRPHCKKCTRAKKLTLTKILAQNDEEHYEIVED